MYLCNGDWFYWDCVDVLCYWVEMCMVVVLWFVGECLELLVLLGVDDLLVLKVWFIVYFVGKLEVYWWCLWEKNWMVCWLLLDISGSS